MISDPCWRFCLTLKMICLSFEMKKSIFQLYCSLYFSVGLIMSIIKFSWKINSFTDTTISKWKISLQIINLIFVVVTMIMIIAVTKLTVGGLNSRSSALHVADNIFIFAVAVPLCFLTQCLLCLQTFIKFNEIKSVFYKNFAVVDDVMFILLIMLIVGFLVIQSMINEHLENIEFENLNRATLSLVFISLLNGVIFLIACHFGFIMQRLSESKYNITYYYYPKPEENDHISLLVSYLMPIKLTFLLVILGLYIGVIRNVILGTSAERDITISTGRRLTLSSQFRVSYNGQLFTIILGLIIVILSLFATALRLLKGSTRNQTSLFYWITFMCNCAIGIVCSSIILVNMKKWNFEIKSNSWPNVVDQYLTWIGNFGQLVFIFWSIFIATELRWPKMKTQKHKIGDVEFVVVCLSLLFLFGQVLLQSMIVSIGQMRQVRPVRQLAEATQTVIDRWMRYVCPSLTMAFVNLATLLFLVYQIPVNNVQRYPLISLSICSYGLHIFGVGCSLVHRIHGVVYFSKMTYSIFN